MKALAIILTTITTLLAIGIVTCTLLAIWTPEYRDEFAATAFTFAFTAVPLGGLSAWALSEWRYE
jgi:hypothetical protein